MPSVPQTWFQANFGSVPPMLRKPEVDPLGRPVPRLDPGYEHTIPEPGLFTNYTPDIIAEWQDANAARLRALNEQAGSAYAKVIQDRTRAAAARVAIQNAMTATRIKTGQTRTTTLPDDRSPLNVDEKAAATAPAMITPSSVAKDLGRNITAADPFQVGWDTKTEQVYGRAAPTSKFEAMLDVQPLVGQTTQRVAKVVHALYRDSTGAAMRYAQENRLTAQDIGNWQKFFVAAGKLQPGSFVPKAWDDKTQAAMYTLMGEANAMGQKVDNMRSMYEQAWSSLGGTPGGGWGPSAGGSGGPAAPRDTTQTVYSITSLAKGSELIRSYLQQQLGRDPNKAEIAAYVRLLNGQERKNPTITSTHYSADGSATTSTVKDANVDPGNTAHDFVTQDMAKELEGRKTMEYMSALAGM